MKMENKNKMKLFTAIFSLTLCAILCGCKTYSVGSSLPEGQRDIFVNVSNLTTENALTALVDGAICRRLEGVPGIDVLNSDENAGLNVNVKLEKLDQSRLASAKIRDSKDRDRDSDAYQSVLFRQTLTASWTAVAKDGAKRSGSVTATADMPLMNNVELSQANALKELARDLAHKVSEAILD
jgi:hypothetical protein